MKRTLLAASAALIFGLPLAAHAQPNPAGGLPPASAGDHGDYTLKQREDWLSNRIDKAKDDGAIDGHEADRVRRELDHIKHDEDHYRDHHGGSQLTDNETTQLEGRLDQLADQIHWLHENGFRRPW